MSNGKIVALKVAVWLACLYPVLSLTYRAIFTSLGPDPTRTITFATGLQRRNPWWIKVVSYEAGPHTEHWE